MLTRRTFFSKVLAGAAAAALAPADALAMPGRAGTWTGRASLVPFGDVPEDEFWKELRKEFPIPTEEAFFNTGTLGVSPRPVLDAVIQHMRWVEESVAHWDYKPTQAEWMTGYQEEVWVREKLATLVGAKTEEIALTQNATFGMNFVANGLALHPGDEVLMTNQEHPGGSMGWQLKSKRYGIYVKQLPVPIPPEDPQQLIDLYVNATTPQTRVWAIPHVTSQLAITFPVKELCHLARDRGIFTAVDGAQVVGHLKVDVKKIGCDAYFSSPHKWLLAPKGTGFLYVRSDRLEEVWTTLASTEWDNHRVGAYRLMQYGTGNFSVLKGLEKAIDFHMAIGSERIERRIRGLADRLRSGLREIPGATIRSPTHPALTCATTVYALDGWRAEALMDALWERAKVRVRSMGDPWGVRHCCHIYNLEEEVDRTLETLRAMGAERR
ncbi:MAG: aminotransferase class V-fold PLP-dependent enzyme [Gemmatimonadetes bacterium]|nr:aminotransferase class V-fold PLP-dependent enzyme [Gemmatimonadota bacterium]